MKKTALIVLIVIESIGIFLSFLGLLISNWLVALISLPFLVLGVIPWLILLDHIDQIEQLSDQLSRLHTRVHLLEKQLTPPEATDENKVVYTPRDTLFTSRNIGSATPSPTRWECVKCGAVNRENTALCENCGAHFSDEQKQVLDAPLTKWKIMRDKKKRK